MILGEPVAEYGPRVGVSRVTAGQRSIAEVAYINLSASVPIPFASFVRRQAQFVAPAKRQPKHPTPPPTPAAATSRSVASSLQRKNVDMGGEHRGVPYALTLRGEHADPVMAAPLVRGYCYLACKEFAFVNRGQVRVAHFAHYSDREVTCSRETVMHEAAKLRLRDMLRAGVRAFHLKVACPGYQTAFGNAVPCDGDNHAVVALRVPAFDYAGEEVPFPPYRLDAAATRDESVVFALEVYQSHRADEA